MIEDRQTLLARIRDRLAQAPDGVLQDIALKLGIARAAVTEVQEIEKHYEKFSEVFQKTGTTREDFRKAFRSEQKKRPGLTADEYLHPNQRR
jgi:hypothetical protein